MSVVEMAREQYGFEDICVVLNIRTPAARAAVKALVLKGRTHDRYANRHKIRRLLRVVTTRQIYSKDFSPAARRDYIRRSLGALPATAGE